MSVTELFPVVDTRRSYVEIAGYEEAGCGLSSFIVTVETPHGAILYYQTVFHDKALAMARQAAFRFALKRIVDSTEATE